MKRDGLTMFALVIFKGICLFGVDHVLHVMQTRPCRSFIRATRLSLSLLQAWQNEQE